MRRSIWLVVALAASSASLLAQTGEISGIVTDPAGAAIPGARVSIRETATGARRAAETNAEGVYAAPALLPGEYTIAIQREGFKQAARTGLQLQVGQQLRLDFRMEIGAVTGGMVR
jgi:hypothetical protein